ncbi:hypothetical protein B0A52_06499 [Exophiala mesophila]|uniref:Prephenate dehydratase n=1 Tax=Exophiala mesophila TaxID=212818 RepID=A0A438N172_EXOME|nr:hypothetical protein B0A52_06499 [Exophiala mesophila]
MSAAREKQVPAHLHVAYLGPEASFSHQAALALFPPPSPDKSTTTSSSSTDLTSSSPLVTLHPLPSFSSIFSSLQNSSQPPSTATTSPATSNQIYDYAVIPIENSTNGSVVQVLDLLSQSGLVHQSQSQSQSLSSSPSTSEPLYPSLSVCAEYYLPVHHCLYIHSSNIDQEQQSQLQPLDLSTVSDSIISQISNLYTHPQVWGQCSKFLARYLPPPHVERIDLGSTSAAAALVSREGQKYASGRDGGHQGNISAAICSKLAGEKHGLTCLAENIEDEVGLNTTRFLVLRNEDLHQRLGRGVGSSSDAQISSDWKSICHQQLISKRWTSIPTPSNSSSPAVNPVPSAPAPVRHKSLITFTIPHRKPGSLADALAVFKRYGFNLTSIDTRPSRRRNWQYVFFVECEEAGPDAEGKALGGAMDATTSTLEDNASGPGANDSDHLPDTGDNLRRILYDLRLYTESLRYVGRFVDQLQE